MKPILLALCGLALLPVLRADPMDSNPSKPRKGEEIRAHPQQPIVTQKVHPGNNHGQFHANRLPGNPMLQGNPNVRFYGPPRHQGEGQSHIQNQVQSLGRQHHFQLSNGLNPRVASTKFRPDNRIVGSEKWQGQHYNAFRNYKAQWHDRDWWRQHCNRIVLISGGW